MPRIDLSRVPPFYHNYIKLVHHENLDLAFKMHQSDLVSLLKSLPAGKWDYRYASGKWTVKELVQHIIDGERIFSYRALSFSRNDKTELPGFDENTYADASEADRRSGVSLVEELGLVQQSTARLFQSFSSKQLERTGIANENPVYVEAIGFIIVGHALHHKNILEERYL